MNSKSIVALVATALALGVLGTPAYADNNNANDASFTGMWKMDYLDKNKDGMVSKTEFVQMMTKMWDMKAKEMKIQADKMTAEEFKKFRESFSAG
jgi:Ca2+-binding EF-hand superfamily protein